MVILLRGAPGSGKSTWAATYKAIYPAETAVISATEFFRGADGIVRFEAGKLKESHLWCAQVFFQSMHRRIPRIIIDNTNLRGWEYRVYWMGVVRTAYRIFQHVCSGTWPNTSGVPEPLVKTMRRRLEVDKEIPHYHLDDKELIPSR